jgi:hypothetical protein
VRRRQSLTRTKRLLSEKQNEIAPGYLREWHPIEAGLDGSDIAITRLPREEQRQPFENPAHCQRRRSRRPPFGEEVSVASNSAARRARHDCIRVPLGLSIGSMIPDISTYLFAENPI